MSVVTVHRAFLISCSRNSETTSSNTVQGEHQSQTSLGMWRCGIIVDIMCDPDSQTVNAHYIA